MVNTLGGGTSTGSGVLVRKTRPSLGSQGGVGLEVSGSISLSSGNLQNQRYQIATASVTNDQDNFAPGGSGAWSAAEIFRLDPTSGIAWFISGFQSGLISGTTGTMLKQGYNVATGTTLIIGHESAGSSPVNRVWCPGSTDLALGPGCRFTLFWDVTTGRWRAT